MRFATGWRRIKNLWDYYILTGKPYSLDTTQPRSHGIEGRAAVRGGARGDPGFCLRSIDCGTVLVPVPVPGQAMSLVFPADFAARSEQALSETPAGRPAGVGGGLGGFQNTI